MRDIEGGPGRDRWVSTRMANKSGWAESCFSWWRRRPGPRAREAITAATESCLLPKFNSYYSAEVADGESTMPLSMKGHDGTWCGSIVLSPFCLPISRNFSLSPRVYLGKTFQWVSCSSFQDYSYTAWRITSDICQSRNVQHWTDRNQKLRNGGITIWVFEQGFLHILREVWESALETSKCFIPLNGFFHETYYS